MADEQPWPPGGPAAPAVVRVDSATTGPLAHTVVGVSLADVQAKAAAALPAGTAYFFAQVDAAGTLLDFGSGVV